MNGQPDSAEGGEAPCHAHLLTTERTGLVVELDRVPPGDGGAVWSLPHDGDLDANLVRLGPGQSIGAHVNGDVDVLIVVRRGDGSLRVDDVTWPLAPDSVGLVPVGSRRSISAGTAGLEYLSIHRRRDGLAIGHRRSGGG